MTKTFNLFTVSAAALIAGAAHVHAQSVPQSVIDAVVADLSAQGFTRIEIDVERNRLDVDAYGPNREGDFYYTRAGQLLSSDIDEGRADRNASTRTRVDAYEAYEAYEVYEAQFEERYADDDAYDDDDGDSSDSGNWESRNDWSDRDDDDDDYDDGDWDNDDDDDHDDGDDDDDGDDYDDGDWD